MPIIQGCLPNGCKDTQTTSYRKIASSLAAVLASTSFLFAILSMLDVPCVAFQADFLPIYGFCFGICSLLAFHLNRNKEKPPQIKIVKKATVDPPSSNTDSGEIKKAEEKEPPRRKKKTFFRSPHSLTLYAPKKPQMLHHNQTLKSSYQASSVKPITPVAHLKELILQANPLNPEENYLWPTKFSIEIWRSIFLSDDAHFSQLTKNREDPVSYIVFYADNQLWGICGIQERLGDKVLTIPLSSISNIQKVWNELSPRLPEIYRHIDRSKNPILIVSPPRNPIGSALLTSYLMQKTDLSFALCHKYIQSKAPFIDLNQEEFGRSYAAILESREANQTDGE